MIGKPFHTATDSSSGHNRATPSASYSGSDSGAAGRAKRTGRRYAAVVPNSLMFPEYPDARGDNAAFDAALQSDKIDRGHTCHKSPERLVILWPRAVDWGRFRLKLPALFASAFLRGHSWRIPRMRRTGRGRFLPL